MEEHLDKDEGEKGTETEVEASEQQRNKEHNEEVMTKEEEDVSNANPPKKKGEEEEEEEEETSPKKPTKKVRGGMELQPGDHVIRWEMLPIAWPIQVHGIVLEAHEGNVVLVDFGLTAIPKNDKKGSKKLSSMPTTTTTTITGMVDNNKEDATKTETATEPQAPTKSSSFFVPKDMEDAFLKSMDPVKGKQRLNVCVLQDPDQIRQWKKVNYDGGLFGFGGSGGGNEEQNSTEQQSGAGGGSTSNSKDNWKTKTKKFFDFSSPNDKKKESKQPTAKESKDDDDNDDDDDHQNNNNDNIEDNHTTTNNDDGNVTKKDNHNGGGRGGLFGFGIISLPNKKNNQKNTTSTTPAAAAAKNPWWKNMSETIKKIDQEQQEHAQDQNDGIANDKKQPSNIEKTKNESEHEEPSSPYLEETRSSCDGVNLPSGPDFSSQVTETDTPGTPSNGSAENPQVPGSPPPPSEQHQSPSLPVDSSSSPTTQEDFVKAVVDQQQKSNEEKKVVDHLHKRRMNPAMAKLLKKRQDPPAATEGEKNEKKSEPTTTTKRSSAAVTAAATALPKADPPKLVLARTRWLLQHGEAILPKYNCFHSNSECIAVFCKTGYWRNIQADVFLHSTAIGNAKTMGAATLGVAASVPFLAPVVGVAGLAMVGAPWLVLAKSKEKAETFTQQLTDAFWEQADNEVFVECIKHWTKFPDVEQKKVVNKEEEEEKKEDSDDSSIKQEEPQQGTPTTEEEARDKQQSEELNESLNP